MNALSFMATNPTVLNNQNFNLKLALRGESFMIRPQWTPINSMEALLGGEIFHQSCGLTDRHTELQRHLLTDAGSVARFDLLVLS